MTGVQTCALPISQNCKLDYRVSYEPSSPISLLWTPNARVGEAATLVQFKLDISSSSLWYVWYGSADTPLLVYDPADTRRVTSVTQLFGNWTFGGDKRASANRGTMTDAAKDGPQAPWRDGYEALATLDSNGDGRVAGEELSVLADRKSTRLNSSHIPLSRMPSSA